jgi:hypothetical protein
MQTRQIELSTIADPTDALAPLVAMLPTLVLVFGAPVFFGDTGFCRTLPALFPGAVVVGCSTAGEISATGVHTGTCVVTAVRFAHTTASAAWTELADMDDSAAAGRRLGERLKIDAPRAVMVFGTGIRVNGSALIAGLSAALGPHVAITGGLAGDNGAFLRTWTLGPAGVSDHAVVAVALGGSRLTFSQGSYGGWEPFGPARKVTRCAGNILYELDGEPALYVYRRYLGDYARDLPASGLLFPFAMLTEDRDEIGLIRTILGIDEADGSVVLAGEIEPGGHLRLMHASPDALVAGAESAAHAVRPMADDGRAGLALLISCVGRKLVMGDRVDEEVEAVAGVLGQRTVLTGFYSYGEIGSLAPHGICKLQD